MRGPARRWWSTIAALVMLVLGPGTAAAQEGGARYRWWLGLHDVAFEGYLGLANHGRFLLQTLDIDLVDVNPQRKLTGSNSFSWGVAVGARVTSRTRARLMFNWTRPDLEYEDDTGLDLDAFDIDDLGELTSTSLGVELLRYLLPEWRRFNAYAGAGVIVTWWDLDRDAAGTPFVTPDELQFRFGGSGILGLQYRTSRRFAVRLEAATLAPGNPFSGNNSYVPVTGLTIDEPSHVRQTNLRLLVAYTVGREIGGRGRRR